MQPQDIPRWMRFSSYRNFEEEARSTRLVGKVTSLWLFGTFVALSVIAYHVYLVGFHVPLLVACMVGYMAMLLRIDDCGIRVVAAYLVAGVALNCLMTYIAVNEDTLSVKVALAEVIVFTGLAGILISSRTKERLSRLKKGAMMCTVVAILILSLKFYSLPPDGILEYVSMWLLAAIGPMVFLTVIIFVTLIARHQTEQTLPSDKWV